MIRRLARVAAAALACALVATPAFARHHKDTAANRWTLVSCFDGDRYAACAGPSSSRPRAPQRQAADAAKARRDPPAAIAATSPLGASGDGVVEEARKYIGTNPTGRRSLWCGAFMDLVLRRSGHPDGGNLARSYANYGQRVAGPRIGALAVMARRGGGHVGVVSGIDRKGNPIIISGNHNHTVAEAVYPRRRVYAYVLPP